MNDKLEKEEPAQENTGQDSGTQKTWAQEAAEHDAAFDKLPSHMADYYDNEHLAEVRGSRPS